MFVVFGIILSLIVCVVAVFAPSSVTETPFGAESAQYLAPLVPQHPRAQHFARTQVPQLRHRFTGTLEL